MSVRRAKLIADAAKCDGHGICVLRAPDLLTLDAWGFVGVDTDEPLSGRDLRKARSAVAACPERALSLVDVQVPGGKNIFPRPDSTAWTHPAAPSSHSVLPDRNGPAA
ncbi:MAG: ferredoxin [Actinomycetota bacterium]|jgi:ferredoxin|nr:ferredoxin [Actinomycetota bacterium]